MKKNRVDCADCTNFEFPEYNENLFLGKVRNAKCKLGKRVAFRVNGLHPESSSWESGWFRYCDEFNRNNEK